VDERPLFQGADEAEEAENELPSEGVADHAPMVGGMGVMPGSGATGITSAGMAPPVPAAAAQQAADDVMAEDEPDEEASEA
jgi:hypothetical protein